MKDDAMKLRLQEHWEAAPVPNAQKRRHDHITNILAARILAVLLGAQGVLCVLFRDYVHSVFPYILGVIMVIIGLSDLYRGIKTQEYKRVETKLTSNGIVMLLLGVIILVPRENADDIIGSVWGAIGLFKGSEELNVAIYQKFAGEPFVWKAVHAVVELLLAVVLLLDPLVSVKHHILILGLELIWHSIKLFRESKRRKF